MSRRLEWVLLTLLSASRFGLAVAFVLSSDVWVRLLLVALTGLTDVVDGWWARARKLTTRFGALLDPLADRTFVLTALTVYMSEGALAVWAYAVLLIRDVATTLAYFITRITRSFRRVPFQARVPGKVVTAVQFLVLLLLPLMPGVIPVLVGLAAAASLWAVYDYAWAVWRRRQEGERPRFPDQPLEPPLPQTG